MQVASLAVRMDGGRLAVEPVHAGAIGPLCHKGLHLREQMVPTKPRVHYRLPGLPNGRAGTFHGNGQMPHELALGRYRDAGDHKTLLLKLLDPVGKVDVVPVVAVPVGAVDAARELEGFLGMHHANLQRDVLMGGGGFHGSVVLFFGKVVPYVGKREVLEELDPVSARAGGHKADLVEGPVQYLQHGSILTVLQAFVVERQPLVLDGHDHLPRSAQYLHVEGTALFGPEGVLDDVQADQFDGPVHRLDVPQAEPKGNLVDELDHWRQEPSIRQDHDAGDRFLRRYLHLGHKRSFFQTTIRTSTLFSQVSLASIKQAAPTKS